MISLHLDLMVNRYLTPSILNNKRKPYELTSNLELLKNSVVLAQNTEDLSIKEEDIRAGLMVNIENKNIINSSAMLVVPLGYALCLDMSKDENLFMYSMMNLLNSVKTIFTKTVGDLDTKTISLKNTDGRYFVDCENIAAMKLTFIVE